MRGGAILFYSSRADMMDVIPRVAGQAVRSRMQEIFMVNILYCDDQAKFREKFERDHATHYAITTCADVGALSNLIANMRKLPDLLLLDLYHPRATGSEQAANEVAAEASLDQLDGQIEITKRAVLEAWTPAGLEMLRTLRQAYPAEVLPIALYTQKGLLLLNDAELREAELLEAEWLLKKRMDPTTERIWIDRIVQRAAAKRARAVVGKYKWLLILSWLALAVSLAAHFFTADDLMSMLAKTIAGIIGAVAAYLVGLFLGPDPKRKAA